MKESYVEDLANQSGPESCACARKVMGEALTGGGIGDVLSRERLLSLERRRSRTERKATRPVALVASYCVGSARSETLCMYRNTLHGSREIPHLARSGILVRIVNSKEAR